MNYGTFCIASEWIVQCTAMHHTMHSTIMLVHSAPLMPVQRALYYYASVKCTNFASAESTVLLCQCTVHHLCQCTEHSAIMPVHTLLLTFLPFPSNCSSQASTLFLKQGKGINLQNNQNDKSISCLIITNTIACISLCLRHLFYSHDEDD